MGVFSNIVGLQETILEDDTRWHADTLKFAATPLLTWPLYFISAVRLGQWLAYIIEYTTSTVFRTNQRTESPENGFEDLKRKEYIFITCVQTYS